MLNKNITIVAGCILVSCRNTSGQLEQNVTDPLEDDSSATNKERFRRLIPYMTFYLDQGFNTQNQYLSQTPQQYQAVDPLQQQAVDSLQQYYMTQQHQQQLQQQQIQQQQQQQLQQQQLYAQQQQEQQNRQLVPVGYLVGGGYRRVPVYSRPTAQADYSDVRYTQQQPSDLTRTVAQNYLSFAKEQQAKDQRPAQYTTKLHYANQNHQQTYKQPQNVGKPYHYQRHRFQSNHRRQPYVVKSYRPTLAPVKEDSYVQLHDNFDVNYEVPQKVKTYVPEPETMIAKNPGLFKYAVEEEPAPVQISQPPATITKLRNDYEQTVPTVPTVEQNDVLDLLAGYQLTKALPDKVTPSNIGHSIQTLSNILKLLQKAKAQSSVKITSDDLDGDSFSKDVSSDFSPYQTEGSTPGRAGVDYPAYAEIPTTDFSCKNQRYKGFFGDPETSCQVNACIF